MKRPIVFIVVLVVLGASIGAYYFRRNGQTAIAETATGGGPGNGRGGAGTGGPGGGGFGGGFGGPGGGFGGGFRMPMSVEVDAVKRADLAQEVMVVGNLVGAATVEATPKVSGRLDSVMVRLGDRVTIGQPLAKIEDSELVQQIKQAQASFEVAAATIRQREADLRLAQTNLDRSKNLFERQLIPKQTYDDTDARYQAGVAQLDLAKAQYAQAQARMDELKINLANTRILSPVNGFIGKRTLDPGAWVTPNSALLSVVDIGVVRLVVNIVERDLRRITQGLKAEVEVDAFPDERFNGHVAHVAPVLDPATRTAQIEIDIPNPNFRLKPGMYAKVHFKVDQRANTLVVPTNALVDVQGTRGVFQPDKNEQGDVARFKAVQLGTVNETHAEVMSGLAEGETIVTTGATALRDGDRIVLPGAQGGREGGGRQGAGPNQRQEQGQAPGRRRGA